MGLCKSWASQSVVQGKSNVVLFETFISTLMARVEILRYEYRMKQRPGLILFADRGKSEMTFTDFGEEIHRCKKTHHSNQLIRIHTRLLCNLLDRRSFHRLCDNIRYPRFQKHVKHRQLTQLPLSASHSFNARANSPPEFAKSTIEEVQRQEHSTFLLLQESSWTLYLP